MSTPVKFETVNHQNDGAHSLKRMEFEFQGTSYRFSLNPEEYTQTETARVTVTQTKGGAWVDDFGSGLPTISIKGTTGFKGNSNQPYTGFAKFKQLRDMVRKAYDAVTPGTAVNGRNELIFHNYTDGEHWVVVPTTFQLMRSVSRPLLYSYNIQMTCIRPASTPPSVNDWQYMDALEYVNY